MEAIMSTLFAFIHSIRICRMSTSSPHAHVIRSG